MDDALDAILVASDGRLLGGCDGEAEFKAFLAKWMISLGIHSVATVADLDGDEVGYLVAKVVETKRRR